MNLALRKIIYDPISYIHPQRVSLNNTPINNPVLRSITNEMILLQYNLSVEHFNLNSSLIYYINNWTSIDLFTQWLSLLSRKVCRTRVFL